VSDFTALSDVGDHRCVFAVLTLNEVLVYDTHQSLPLVVAKRLHFASLTDAAWSADGKVLAVSSSDGYVSVLAFTEAEIGTCLERAAVAEWLPKSRHNPASLPKPKAPKPAVAAPAAAAAAAVAAPAALHPAASSTAAPAAAAPAGLVAAAAAAAAAGTTAPAGYAEALAPGAGGAMGGALEVDQSWVDYGSSDEDDEASNGNALPEAVPGAVHSEGRGGAVGEGEGAAATKRRVEAGASPAAALSPVPRGPLAGSMLSLLEPWGAASTPANAITPGAHFSGGGGGVGGLDLQSPPLEAPHSWTGGDGAVQDTVAHAATTQPPAAVSAAVSAAAVLAPGVKDGAVAAPKKEKKRAQLTFMGAKN
jgi:hypothetical protein